MKTASLCFSVAALVTGVIAALFWFLSARVDFKSLGRLADLGNPTDSWINALAQWSLEIADKVKESGRLNKWAAIWTGISVVLSGIGSVLGTLGS